MKLTNSQSETLERFKQWLGGVDGQGSNDEPRKVFVINGAAGTGKTTLLNEILRTLGGRHKAALMAPTGRAAQILSQRTGRKASTIHRAIYNFDRVVVNNATGFDRYVYELRNNDDDSDTIYVVDEASMISDIYSEAETFRFGSGYLLADLFQFVGARPMVFVGDYAQLPPVGMSISPAFDDEYLWNKYHVKTEKVELREIVRQDRQSGILTAATEIRRAIDKNVFNNFSLPSTADCICIDDEGLVNKYVETTGNKPAVDTILIAYTNRQVLHYNREIREHYFMEYHERLHPGELLIISRNNYAYDVELFNGNIVRVKDCQKNDEIERRTVKYKGRKDSSGVQTENTLELRFRKATIEFNHYGQRKELSLLILDNLIDSDEDEQELAQALKVDFSSRHKNLKRNSPEYLEALRKDKYVNALVCKYAYAITCHKSQGGEWTNVFTDMWQTRPANCMDYFRWAYTAITRAKICLWHYLAPKINVFSKLRFDGVRKGNCKISIQNMGPNYRDAFIGVISAKCAANNLECEEIRRLDYEQLFSVSTIEGTASTIIRLRNNAKGYTGAVETIKASPEEFGRQVVKLAERALRPEEVRLEDDLNDCQSTVFEIVKDACAASGVTIMNAEKLGEYLIRFSLLCDDFSTLDFYNDAKGLLSYFKAEGRLGKEDEKLQQVCSFFK